MQLFDISFMSLICMSFDAAAEIFSCFVFVARLCGVPGSPQGTDAEVEGGAHPPTTEHWDAQAGWLRRRAAAAAAGGDRGCHSALLPTCFYRATPMRSERQHAHSCFSVRRGGYLPAEAPAAEVAAAREAMFQVAMAAEALAAGAMADAASEAPSVMDVSNSTDDEEDEGGSGGTGSGGTGSGSQDPGPSTTLCCALMHVFVKTRNPPRRRG